jgi:hypothetical protein
MNTTTGKIAWSSKLPQKMYSGIVVAGDLVFFGEGNGKFNAVDAQTGNVLWTFQSNLPNVGGANGAPAVYVVNGREYVVMDFGGNADARFTKGDALIAFALPQSGQTQPLMVQANPVQVDTGDLPASATQPPLTTAPPDARVVELVAHDFAFEPRSFTALPGEKIAVQIVNTTAGGTGFTITLPMGRIGLNGAIAGNQSGYFVFTAPSQPGVYEFFGSARFFGMTGEMRVGPACPTSRMDRKVDSRLPAHFREEWRLRNPPIPRWSVFGRASQGTIGPVHFRIGPENRARPTLICACFFLETGWRTRTAVTIRGSRGLVAQAAAR